MKSLKILIILCVTCQPALASNLFSAIPESLTSNTWRIATTFEGSYTDIDGSLINSERSSDQLGTSFFSSTDAMGLESKALPSLSLYAHKNRLSIGLHYNDIDFQGEGIGSAALTSDSIGGFIAVPLESALSLELFYGSLHYNLIQTDNTAFGFGIGAGLNRIDVDLHSNNSYTYAYHSDEPYGFISMHMLNRHNKFFYGFVLNAIAVSDGNVSESYADYQIDFGYRIYHRAVAVDILGGWQLQQIHYQLSGYSSHLSADIELSGPTFGISLTW